MFDWLCNISKIVKKLDKIMTALEDANAKLDTVVAAVGDLQTDVQALVTLTELLKQQVAAGQVDAALVEQISGKLDTLATSIGAIDESVEGSTGVQTP